MAYESQIEQMWINLSMLTMAGGEIKRPATSRDAYDEVCRAFYQAEDCPLSLEVSADIKAFRAESNIWAYYVGEGKRFTGVDPSISSLTASFSSLTTSNTSSTPSISSLTTAFSTLATSDASSNRSLANAPLSALQPKAEAVAMKREILRKGKDVRPQFGWNPKTGEPWFATKCFAREAYPALCGPQGTFLNELHRLTEHFALRCVRFEEEGYVLLWPEFNDLSAINSPRLRTCFNQFRAFLLEWASGNGVWSNGHRRARIDIAYKAFINRPNHLNQPLPLSEGFAFGFAFDG